MVPSMYGLLQDGLLQAYPCLNPDRHTRSRSASDMPFAGRSLSARVTGHSGAVETTLASDVDLMDAHYRLPPRHTEPHTGTTAPK